jgi:hypothetical protein
MEDNIKMDFKERGWEDVALLICNEFSSTRRTTAATAQHATVKKQKSLRSSTRVVSFTKLRKL